MFLALVLGILSILSNRKMILDRLKSDIKGNITKVKLYKKYENGYTVYYNPIEGEICTDYTEDNSKTGINEGCLKWYIFNDNGNNDSVNMILDHNTTALVAWNSSGNNADGMKEVKTALESDTREWKQTARLITVNEIANITGAKDALDWTSDKIYESTPVKGTSISYYYLDGADGTDTTWHTQVVTTQGASKYAWLYDYTNACTSFGCNTADSSNYGYWTSISVVGRSYSAWSVVRDGALYNFNVDNDNLYGVRPVITIKKSEINSKFITINFNANGGTVDSKFKITLENSSYGDLPTPTRTDYRFDGWYTAIDGGTKITSDTIVTADQTLYAHWTHYKVKSVTSSKTSYYLKLQDAFNEASTTSSTTITLLENVTENITISTALKSTTLNLNAKTLNGYITNNNNTANITIKNGTIKSTATHILYNKGTMTVTDGNYSTTNTSTKVIGINNYGTFNLKGGTVTTQQGFTVNNFGRLNISGGKIKHTLKGSTGTALYNNTNGVIRATGGTVESTAFAFVNGSNTGTSDDSKKTILQNMNISVTYAEGHVTILNRTNSNTLTKNCVLSSASTQSILYNESGMLMSFNDNRKQSKISPVMGEVYMLSTFADGHIQISVFGRTDVTTFPTWTDKNAQDDIQWYGANKYTDSQGTYYYTGVFKSNHNNETGTYHTHIYAGSTFLAGFSYTMS